MKHSKNRHTFQRDKYIERCRAEGKEPLDEYIKLLDSLRDQDKAKSQDTQWQQNNLEYDLRSTDWICAKAQASRSYAQNIYAALCNTQWQRNDTWPRLADQRWSCSWRYAGGIVADMREEGDYIDWYCSGIREISEADQGFVPEGTVTDEVQQDLFGLGWILVEHRDKP